MNILIIDSFMSGVVRKVSFVPRIGDVIEWDYQPFPVVNKVLVPKDNTEYDAIIYAN